MYKNPIPHVDDEQQSKDVYISFSFPEPVTKEEAADSLNEWFLNNKVTPESVRLIGNVTMRHVLPQPK